MCSRFGGDLMVVVPIQMELVKFFDVVLCRKKRLEIEEAALF